MQPYFITATGTNIGKTLVTTTLCWQLRQKKRKVTALKPVISGYDPADPGSDSALILKSCGLTPTPPLMETISPWRYAAPVAPAMAAAKEGHPVRMDALLSFCRDHAALKSDILLVEGAGGLMVPLNDTHTILDWITALDWPVILACGSYLGSLSHTLTAAEALKSRGATLHALIVSESEYSTVPFEDTASMLEKFLPKDIPIVKLPRIMTKEDPWKHAAPIDWLCNP